MTTSKPPVKTGMFYGWIVLAAATLTYFLAGGMRFGAFGVFLKPITEQFGWTRAQASFASSLGSMQGAVEGLVTGSLSDRFGPKIVMFGGFLLVGFGFIVLSMTNNIILFYIAYVPMISFGFGAVQLPSQSAVNNWFIRKRARAFAILTGGFAVGGFVIIPIIGQLVGNYGWQTTSVILGITVLVVGFAATFFIRRRPEDHGMLPDGDPLSAGAQVRRALPKEIDFTFGEALRTKSFWFLGAGMMLTQLATSAVMVHAVSLMTDRNVTPATATFLFGFASFWGLLGRFFWGYMGDKFHKNMLLAFAIVVQAIGVVILAYGGASMPLMIAFAVFYGIGQGSVPVQFAIRGEYFGRKKFATIAGGLQVISTVGGIAGPFYAGYVYDKTGSYITALTIIAYCSLLGCLAFFLAKRPAPPTPATKPT